MNKKEEISIKFKNRINEGKSIKYKDIKSEDSSLLYAIERHFGSIFKCATYLGISEDDLINKYGMHRNINSGNLPNDEIKNRLLYLKSIGKLTTSAMRTEFDDLRLEGSLKRIHGSVNNGLAHYGLKRDSRLVTMDSLINKIHKLHREGEDLSYINMINNHSKIIYTICNKLHKSWYGILDDLEIPYEAKRRNYSRELIIKRLGEIFHKHGTLSYGVLRKYGAGIVSYADRNYDSIYDFYTDFGYNPMEYMDIGTQKFKGYLFERVFKEILDTLKIKYIHNKSICEDGLRPDFQLNDNILLDCKLSSWTSTIETTIEKYTPYCDKLIIVFLRGEESHLKYINNDNVVFRKVDYYLNMLDEESRQYFVNRLNYILNNDNFIETVTTERSIS